MGKGKGGGESYKINFGRRRKGSATKRKGPKDKPVSKYKGQGRN